MKIVCVGGGLVGDDSVQIARAFAAAGRADLCCLARPHLADPYWTLHAAVQLGYRAEEWPVQYIAGRNQCERNLARAAEMVLNA